MSSKNQIITVISLFVIVFGLYTINSLKITEESLLDSQNGISHFDKRNGEELFSQNCAPCHGNNGDGEGTYYGYNLNPKPADFTEKGFFVSRSSDDIAKVIRSGSKSVGKSSLCPPWEGTLHTEEIASITGFLETQFKK